MKKHLFLKWCLATVITLAIVFLSLILAKNQALDLNPIAKTMVGVIVLVYLIATIGLLDLYVSDPLNQIVYFRQKQIGLMSLDRDHTSREQNMKVALFKSGGGDDMEGALDRTIFSFWYLISTPERRHSTNG